MAEKSLGLIETIGLAAAVEAADSAVKSADVALVGYELTRGGGMVTVKVEGDVGAVKAAISAAEAGAERIGSVVGSRVIPRPAPGLEKMVRSSQTVGLEPAEAAAESAESGGKTVKRTAASGTAKSAAASKAAEKKTAGEPKASGETKTAGEPKASGETKTAAEPKTTGKRTAQRTAGGSA